MRLYLKFQNFPEKKLQLEGQIEISLFKPSVRRSLYPSPFRSIAKS